MKNSTRKQKGNAFEVFVMKMINESIDPKCRQTKASGAGLAKGDLYCPSLDWIIDAKNWRKPSFAEFIRTIKHQANDYNRSMVVFKDPKSPDINPEPYVLVSLVDLIQIVSSKDSIKPISEHKTSVSSNNRDLQYKTERLILAAKDFLKVVNRE